MKLTSIKSIQALDSRGNPTVEVILNNNYSTKSIAPSGKSTGIFEAKEIRDGTKNYYFGKSVLKSINSINKIQTQLKNTKSQEDFDRILDENIDAIGSNGSIALSMAYARLSAIENKKSLISYLNGLAKTKKSQPIIFANIINGGVHADNNLKFQEFIITPLKIKQPIEQARAICEIYNTLQTISKSKSFSIGDEGGLSIKGINEDQALSLIESAITKSSYRKNQIRLALDCAASEYYQDEFYYINDKKYSAGQLIDYYSKMIKSHNIYSIEDPFEQTDYTAWHEFNKKHKNILVVGDDLTVSNKSYLQKAITEKLCNSLILKPNQIGTITDSVSTIRLAHKNKINLIASHRSGDTEDSFIVDFAFAMGAKHIKIGAPCRGERTSKYNRFLEIMSKSN